MKILVTGCLGFIGSNFCRMMLKDNYVVGLSRLSDTKYLKRLYEFYDRKTFRMVYADIAEDISGLLEGCDVIVNFAAKTFVDHSIIDPNPFIRSNIIGTFNLLEQARRYKTKLFIQVSTDEVYGPILEGYFSEESKMNPTNPYAASKAGADMLAISYFHTYKLPVIIVRSENNYGIYQHPQKAIPTFIRKALSDEPIPIYGDGHHRRMWIHVEDFCRAIEIVIDKGIAGEIYNIGAKNEKTNIDIAKSILRILGNPEDAVKYIPDYDARPGHDRRYGIENKKILELGWQANHNIDDDLPELCRWYKENQGWLL